jgi:DNA-binding transcriptional regulator YdaS (Cro superfamily)
VFNQPKEENMKRPQVKKNLLKAFKIVGKSKMSTLMGVRYQSVDRWVLTNKMPLTEFNGDTFYSRTIEKATDGAVTVTDLLGWVPVTQTSKWVGFDK